MTQRIVINRQFGGFSLSPKAVKRIAEIEGRECYFFQNVYTNGRLDLNRYKPLSLSEATDTLIFFAFDIPNPNDILLHGDWRAMSKEEREAHNERYQKHSIDQRDWKRDDPLLVQVVEELGDEANGACACLEIVEIPDGVKWQVEEYDGNEWISEEHRTWR